MDTLFYIFTLYPLFVFGFIILIPRYNEQLISQSAISASLLSIILWIVMVVLWIKGGFETVVSKDFNLYTSEEYNYTLSFIFDKVSAVYLGVTTLLTYLISKFSRYYLHREKGYKRFFSVISLFTFSIYIITLSGNFETLFLGWEVLGISSFLLIAYYRERYLPVRNALKVYSYYRVADAGLLIAMWLCHHTWHHNLKFLELSDKAKVSEFWTTHPVEMSFIALFIGLAAAVKSAQFPFSTWLARAMEGPTPSSAIFYGSIAVNIGCFLLLRTYPLYEEAWWIKLFFILFSLVTLLTSSVMSSTQSNVKAQIAYASIGQISIVFIEIVLGFHTLALIHFSGNALLRAYQLLISPSIVTYLMREQFFNFEPNLNSASLLGSKWRNTMLVAGIKEWRIDTRLYKFIWAPVKRLGSIGGMISVKLSAIISIIGLFGLSFVLFEVVPIPTSIHHLLAIILTFIAVLFTAAGFKERGAPTKAWAYLFIAHIWLTIGVGINEEFNIHDSLFYLGGVVLSGIVGYYILDDLAKKVEVNLNDFHGLTAKYKTESIIFFVACITMAGFPLSTTFIGEDLLFTHIEEAQLPVALLTLAVYIIEGIGLLRIYARIFMGPLKSNNKYFAKRYA